jgi:vacuolar-type H+-ATPase subunit I/STV1
MEIEQIDQSHINNMPPDRLKYIIKILNDQLAELEQEVSDIAFPFKMQLQILPFEHLTPQQLLRHLRQDIEELKCDIKQIQADLESFKDLSALKIWLKKYKIPKAVDEHDLLDFMYDDPDFLF